jgi:tRNA(adenine34) deaminase
VTTVKVWSILMTPSNDEFTAAGLPSALQDETHLRWMNEALHEADAAAEDMDVPVGCVIVDAGGLEIGRGRNRRELDRDPTAHAEIIALRQAARRLGAWRLEGCTVYVTLEPCPMCAGALVNARVSRLVYGARDPKAGAVESAFFIGNGAELNHRFAVNGGVAEAQCIARLQTFFARLRANGEK